MRARTMPDVSPRSRQCTAMGKRQRPQKPNATGRNQTPRFVRLVHRLLNSNAYRSLSPNARSLLIELIMLYNGRNNGSLYLSVQDAANRMGVADHHAASGAFNELQVRGFIEMTQSAEFRIKAAETSRARTWRLTWEAGPGKKLPDWTFLEREPEPQTPKRRRMERGLRTLKAYRKARDQDRYPVVDSTMTGRFPPVMNAGPVVDSTTINLEIGGKQPKPCMVDSHHHIATSMGSAVQRSLIGWWEPDWSNITAHWVAAANFVHRAST